MVFPSVPHVFLDPPNWNQLQHSQRRATGGIVGGGGDAHQLIPPALPTRSDQPNVATSARTASMADRAQLAKVPPPEAGLKCPRCDSSNTKFCYFNNYSLSQPRHFCKTCRRYWTRGGALRNVPVGGGFRRNKRSKSGSGSKASAADRQAGASTSSASPAVGISAVPSNDMTTNPQLPYNMPPLNLAHDHYEAASNIGILSFPGIQQIDTVDFETGSNSVVGLDQWKLPQFYQYFPLSAGTLDAAPPPPQPSMNLFTFDGPEGAIEGFAAPVHDEKQSASGLLAQLASVKMEENPPGLNLRRSYLGTTGRSDRHWGGSGGAGAGGGSGSTNIVATSSGGGWMDLTGFNPSSTSDVM